MAIFRPGERHRYHNILKRKKGKRDVSASLDLTAMVDMFTVLVVFLLQNYSATGEIIYIPKEVTLPVASSVKELKPAIVVTISSKEILVDRDPVASFEEVQALGPDNWMIPTLFEKVKLALEKAKADQDSKLQNRLRNVLQTDLPAEEVTWDKVTIQADKGVDVLTVKKVMATVKEAGGGQMNFAVTKQTNDANSN